MDAHHKLRTSTGVRRVCGDGKEQVRQDARSYHLHIPSALTGGLGAGGGELAATAQVAPLYPMRQMHRAAPPRSMHVPLAHAPLPKQGLGGVEQVAPE